jgi:hypothetical protein
MTFITKLTSAFSDTTLPRLLSDPLWNEAGGRLLFDSKNLICHPSQATTLTPSTSLNSAGENSWPVTCGSNNCAYNATTGRITTPGGSNQITIENSGAANSGPYTLFNNASHNFAMSFWVYVPSSFTQRYSTYFSKGAGNVGSGNSLAIYFNDLASTIRIARPKSTDANISSNLLDTATLSAGVYRIGVSWQKVAGNWARYGIIGQNTALSGNGSVDTFGTGTDGIQLPGAGVTWDSYLFGNVGFGFPSSSSGGMGIYRFYLENLTQSGRTKEQVWDTDWAYANGRFS